MAGTYSLDLVTFPGQHGKAATQYAYAHLCAVDFSVLLSLVSGWDEKQISCVCIPPLPAGRYFSSFGLFPFSKMHSHFGYGSRCRFTMSGVFLLFCFAQQALHETVVACGQEREDASAALLLTKASSLDSAATQAVHPTPTSSAVLEDAGNSSWGEEPSAAPATERIIEAKTYMPWRWMPSGGKSIHSASGWTGRVATRMRRAPRWKTALALTALASVVLTLLLKSKKPTVVKEAIRSEKLSGNDYSKLLVEEPGGGRDTSRLNKNIIVESKETGAVVELATPSQSLGRSRHAFATALLLALWPATALGADWTKAISTAITDFDIGLVTIGIGLVIAGMIAAIYYLAMRQPVNA